MSDGNQKGTTVYGGHTNAGTIFLIVMPIVLKVAVIEDKVVLSWPTNAVGFTLQSAVDLNSQTNWTDSTISPAVLSREFTITNTISGKGKFYRLKK